MWDFFDLADRLGEIVRNAETALRLEQAVHGLDTLDESVLQGMLAEGLAASYEVAREVHYPSSEGSKLSHRQRCDLVLWPRVPSTERAAAEALWLEVKVARQFGEGGRRQSRYGQQWRRGVVDDLRKMQADPLIRHAGLVLLVCNESPETLAKDLDLFEQVLIEKDVSAGFRQVRSVEITNRIGHRLYSVAAWPVITGR